MKATKKSFTVYGEKFKAEAMEEGVLINPALPKNFDSTPNEDRPPSQNKWWFVKYIVTEEIAERDEYQATRKDKAAEAGQIMWAQHRKMWLDSWPNGTRYDVRCLNGGAWDRSTWLGSYATLQEAIWKAKE
jgi:hypothetical protein